MRERNREWAFRKALQSFGITRDDYDTMAASGCAICRSKDSRGYRLALDHDHETGRFRGLLCGERNTRLGWYERRKEAIEGYLCR